jgi:hypothetical protein
MTKFLGTAGLVGTTLFVFFLGYLLYLNINIDRFCIDYLKRAADSNTIELAKKELDKAIKYMEENNLTDGFTSVFYKSPDEDIEWWYTNIKSSRKELDLVKEDATPLEKSNVLMKLRETLLDGGAKGATVVTAPYGISRYPHNALHMFIFIFGCIHVIFLISWLIIKC